MKYWVTTEFGFGRPELQKTPKIQGALQLTLRSGLVWSKLIDQHELWWNFDSK